MVFVKPHKKAQKPGIGLYTYEQEKNSTPFAYIAQIVVGAVLASLGVVLGYAQYESPTRSTGGLVTAAVLIVIGIFLAHARAIFWYRRPMEAFKLRHRTHPGRFEICHLKSTI
jgi:sulfite exporter TauE/SafE